ncbi:MAG: response regulator [Armatimonadetes bacterium]|nr:response regulator [Armatimonadota bacterium]
MPAVLVVNGEQSQFAQIQAILAPAGYGAAWSKNAAAAVRLAHRTPPALILVDSATPCVDAAEAILLLRQDSCTAHVPLVLLCDRTRAGLADGLSTDADMVLEKPVDPVELLTVVGGLLALPRRGERPHYDGAQ